MYKYNGIKYLYQMEKNYLRIEEKITEEQNLLERHVLRIFSLNIDSQ